jgi:2,5-diamino-6-(ribosylamino)-4(3H)-pyrimidinone 5'-phosphate reductase
MRPYVVIHSQVSVDGRIDWLPIDPGLFYELATQWKEDATLAGTDTLLASAEQFGDESGEQEKSTTSHNGPLLVVPDSRGRLKHWESLLSAPYWRGGISLCTKTTPKSHLNYLEKVGVESVIVGDDRVDLRAALECLAGSYGVKTVRVDSGGILNGVLLRHGLVDEVSVLVSPYLVGGVTPKSFFRAPDLTDAADVIGLELIAVEELRDGVVWLKYKVLRSEEAT